MFIAVAVYHTGRDLGADVLPRTVSGLLSTGWLCNAESNSKGVRCGRRFA
jgi:hypothetical protein